MAKGSGGTRGAKSGNSKSSKSWDELKDGWTASLALYRETDRYSAADVKAFEREIENSSFTGPYLEQLYSIQKMNTSHLSIR